MPDWLIWVFVAAGFGIAEVLTLGLVLGMFAAAAGVSAIVAAAGADPLFQIIVFIVAAPLLLGFVRPVAQRHLLRTPVEARTGVQALVGRTALVVEDVSAHSGQVKIGGEIWTARAYDETQVISAGSTADVIAIDGATALVYSPETQ